MDNKEEYLERLLVDLKAKEEQGAKGLFRIGERINHNTADYVKNYFSGKPEYRIDVHSCGGCRGSIWDIVIWFIK